MPSSFKCQFKIFFSIKYLSWQRENMEEVVGVQHAATAFKSRRLKRKSQVLYNVFALFCTCGHVRTTWNPLFQILQSQTKIVGTLRPNAGFFLLVPPLSLSKLFIAVQSPNLVHQHWGDKETQNCPNNFDWDCSTNCYVLYPKSLGNHHHKSPYKDLNAEHIVKESVFTGHRIFVQIIIIWIMLIIIIIRMVGITFVAHQ